MKALLFLNPKRKKRRVSKTPNTAMASRKHRKSRKSRSARRAHRSRKPRVSAARRRTSRRRVVIQARARRGRGAGRLKVSVKRRNRARATISVVGNPRRRMRRNPYHRRHARRNPIGGNLVSSVKGVFSKDNLTLAAGAIAATVVTNQIVSRFGDKLPLINSANPTTKKIGVIAYDVGLPVLGAYLVRRSSPALARGMVLGALVNVINDTLKMFSPGAYSQLYSPTASVGAYLNYQSVPQSLLPVGGPVPATRPPGYSGMNALANVRPTNGALDNSRAFPSDAWN